jgi:hypothetical protein
MPRALAPPLMAAFRPRLRPPLSSPFKVSSLSCPRHMLLTFGDFGALFSFRVSYQFGIQLRHIIPSRQSPQHMNTTARPGAQAPEEVLPVYSDSVLFSLSSLIDLPTLQHCRGLLYGKMTACEASRNRGV